MQTEKEAGLFKNFTLVVYRYVVNPTDYLWNKLNAEA